MDDKVLRESGILLVDKPVDWTSHDVVAFVRGFGFKKVGHCGTLDPQATGLLVLMLGRATKLSNRFSGQDKSYVGTVTLGKETTSQDADGEVIAEYDWTSVTEEEATDAVNSFLGEQMQIPPMVSAKKQNGKKLYKLARQGITVEREAKPITIHELNIDRIELPEIDISLTCSKGTYVRTLAADIGDKLGVGGYLTMLRRTASGQFDVKDAVTIDELREWNKEKILDHFINLEKVLTLL